MGWKGRRFLNNWLTWFFVNLYSAVVAILVFLLKLAMIWLKYSSFGIKQHSLSIIKVKEHDPMINHEHLGFHRFRIFGEKAKYFPILNNVLWWWPAIDFQVDTKENIDVMENYSGNLLIKFLSNTCNYAVSEKRILEYFPNWMLY